MREGNREGTEEDGRAARPARRRGSAAARRDEDPVWIGGSGIARKGPVIGLLGWMLRVAVNNAAVHRARHVDLLGGYLNRHLRVAPQPFGFHDIRAVQAQNPGLERLLGSGTLVDGCGKLLEDLITQQWPQPRLVSVRKRSNNHLECDASTLEELRGIKARVGATNLAQPSRD